MVLYGICEAQRACASRKNSVHPNSNHRKSSSGLKRWLNADNAVLVVTLIIASVFLSSASIAQANTPRDSDYCEVYPLTLPDGLLSSATEGQTFSQIPLGTGQGNFSWLTWNGNNDMPTLANSLIPNGNSDTYRNPKNSADTLIEESDWVEGLPGVKNSRAVRTNFDALVGRDIIIPTWSQKEGAGANTNFQVAQFVIIEATAYRFNGKGWLTFKFKGFHNCYNTPPVAIDSVYETAEDHAVTTILQSEDVDGDDLSYVLLSQPSNGVLSGDTPDLVYTPNPNFYGEDSFTFKVNDGEEDSNQAAVTITVTPINDAPVADDQSVTTDEDRTVSIDLTGSDIDGDSLSFAVQAQPMNGALSGDAPNLVYTPNADFNGNDSFTFKVNDGELDSPHATVSIVVNPVNDAPTADAQSLSLDEDTSASVTLTASDIENDALTYSVLTSPLNGTLSGDAPNLIYTPNADFNGNDSFTFKVNDGELDSPPATVSIVVNPVNDAPTADEQSLSLNEDTSTGVILTGSDIENDALTYSVFASPLNGTLSGDAPSLVYTPNADFNGNDSFTFTVNDGELDSPPAIVSIVVNSVNDAPTAYAQSLLLDEDTSTAVALTGSDIENDALTYSVLASPLNGTLSGDAPNLVYTPNADFNGNDSFTFKVNDGELDSPLAIVSIVVNPVDDAPVANDQSIGTNEDVAVLLELTGSDADGDTLSYSVQTQPINGVLSGTAASIIYTPNAGFNGSDSFTFIVNDGSVNSALATVSIIVTPVNDAPTGDDQNLTTDEGDTLLISLTGSDSDGDVISYTVQTQPVNGSLSGTAPGLTYTPNLGFSGDDSFTFVVNDGAIDSLAANIQITVLEKDTGLLPDLTITQINSEFVVTDPQSSQASGDLSFTVVNQGEDRAIAPFEAVAFYDQDSDGIYSIGVDVRLGAISVTQNLDAAELTEYRLAVSGTLPFTDAPILVFIDSEERITESNETNNLISTANECELRLSCQGAIETTFDPEILWAWSDAKVMTSPVVGPLIDTNDDGKVDANDTPMVIVASHTGFVDTASAKITVINGITGNVEFVVDDVNLLTRASSHPALGDLDADGTPEIIFYSNRENKVVALDNQGQLKWISDVGATVQTTYNYGAISIADIDGDGLSEVLARDHIFNHDGTLRFRLETGFAVNHAMYSTVADIDLDGTLEIVFGGQVYTNLGAPFWQTPSGVTVGFHALGNFDDDDYPEIVVSNIFNTLYLIDHDGSILWQTSIASSGAPVVANLEGDSTPEIGVATKYSYQVYNKSGELLWSAASRDVSGVTGSTAFDFDNDGQAEIAYAAENGTLIFDGATGQTLATIPRGSNTATEAPVVADVDGNGSAEILFVSDKAGSTGYPIGIIALKNNGNDWASTRSIWNQHAYSINNVNDDGSIPANPAKSWLSHNTFRLNAFPQCANQEFQTVYLNNNNISVRLGDSMVADPFENRTAFDSLASIIDAQSADAPEDHNQQTHVWVKGGELELVFDLHREYDLTQLHLWNYFAESFDVDNINFTFFDDSNNLIGSLLNVAPKLGGNSANPIFAETIPLSFPSNVRFVHAELSGSNSEVDFNNIGFTGRLSTAKQKTDLSISKLQFSQSQSRILARFGNGGSLASAADTLANVYRIAATGSRELIGSFEIPALGSGEFVDLALNGITGVLNNDQIEVVIDENNDVNECRENNNRLVITVQVNNPPEIISTASQTSVHAGTGFNYDVDAIDADGDTLVYQLEQAPDGMTIDPQSGVINWVATANQLGNHTITVTATDELGLNDDQSFVLEVLAPLNQAPEFSSTAIVTANVGVTYSYQLEAVDPEGEELTYSLIDGPGGLTINSQTGLISWLPDTLATQDISVNVADPLGLSDTQVWSVVIDDLDALCEFEAPSELITLYGLVTNVNTGLPIAGALVELVNDGNILSKTTGADGNYLFRSLARGASSIEISTPAHLGVQRSLEFDGSNLFEFSVSMTPQNEAGDYIANQTATVRDFNSSHPDFEGAVARDPGIVGPELSDDKKPIYAAPDGSSTPTTSGRENFDQWYRDVDGVNLNAEIELPFVFNQQTGTYSFNDNAFFPIDDVLFGNEGRSHNYHFTMEYENEFRYVGGETFDFSGDDDLWLYINDKLAIDLGFGISVGTVDLDAQADQLGIEIGGVYSIKMFFAERHTILSRFNAETSIGLTALSGLEPKCGVVYFRSVPPQFVTAGSDYRYVARARAASDQPIIYSLSNAPAGMTIDAVTGLLSWSTSSVDEGQYSVAIVAATAQGQLAQQSYVISVTTEQRLEPNISSAPIFLAAAGDTYEYQVEVFDSTSTGVRLELLSGPDGMQVIGNSLSWLPELTDIGAYSLSIAVSNGYDQQDTQTWVLTVFDPSNGIPNLAPVVGSLPPSNQVTVGSTFIYAVVALDPEGQVLNFALGQAPTGMTISASGEIVFTAQAEQLGTHPVEIIVTDPLGGQSSQSFDLLVTPDVADNQAPIIVSQPLVQAIVDQPYVYQVLASDDDGDTLTFRLSSAPAGMSINANSGEINWQPSIEQLGEQLVIVRTEDGRGGSATQSYSVFVNTSTPNNRAPVITSTSIVTARVDLVYNYQVQATDDDGDSLTYSVIEGPSGLTISPTGLVSWSPTSVESVVVVVRVSDQQAYVEQGWTLNVQPADAVLGGQIFITPKVADEAEIVTIQAQAENAIGPVSISVTVNGVDYSLDQNNQVQVIAGGIGVYEIVATIRDDLGVIELKDRFTVRDPNDSDAPLASFDSLVDGQIITAPVDIIASVEDPNINTWQLISRAKSAKADEFTVLASGTTNVINETLGQFDPSLVRNGQYTILLIADDASGQTTQESVTVQVDRDLKVGNFSITFEDLSIPLGGIPISVRRTYDSRDRAQSRDFGFGWSLDYQNVKVEESRTLGLGWSQNEYPTGPLNTLVNVCTEPKGAPIVTVTLPDGDVERFEVGASPRCNLLLPVNRVDLSFTSVGDTQTTLEAVGQSLFYFKNDNLALDIDSDQLANPDQYRLTTRAGFVYELDQNFGVSKVTDPNGNTLTYSDDGIVHSDGKRVDFVRDASGRVTQVIDPMGRALNYAYDNNGDLLTATERDSAVTSFTYNQGHGLLDIIDPLGRNIVRNIYDDDGRLIAQQDSNGLRTEFTHNLTGRESVIRDRNGHTQFLYYDENGYVTSQVDALGNATHYTLDAYGNELSQTNALGNTTVATYNANNDQLTQTDALGNVTSFEYNQRGKETEITDARGNVFVNSYDAVGNLLKVTDPLGNFAGNNINRHGLPTNLVDVLMNVTTFTYDDEGNKLTETDAQDNLTSFSYDANNNVLSETSTRLVNGVAVEETTTFEYDSRDRVIKTTDALGNETQSVYDLVGNQVALIDALGRRTEMQYDVYKRLLKTNYPDGTTQGNSYDPEGNLLTETNRLGRVTTHEYDALNRLVKSTEADGSITRTEYDAIGRVTASVDANGNRSTNTYDAADRRISNTDALGNLTQFAYDADGNMLQMTNANGNVTTYTYNELDQKVQTTFQNGSAMLDGLDALSRKTSSTDQAGVVTNYEYDKLGRLIKVIDALAQETTYSYDSRGNKLTQTDAEGHTTSWAFDALGRVISRTLPLGQTESMAYDAIGNVTQSTDFNGQVTTYTYDVNDRMIGISYQGGLSGTTVYDAVGNRTQATKTENGNTSTWIYTYDNLNRLKTDTQFVGTADEVTLSYDYDAQGNRVMLTETTATATRITRYTFDALNRLSSVQDPEGNTTTYSYDAVGNRTGMSHENGIQTAYAYDELNRLTSLRHKDNANVTLRDFSYTLLANGRREKITEASGRVTDYTFDDLYRLTQETIFDPVNPSYNAAYTYDKVGNRTFEVINGVSTAYTIDANDRLNQTGGTLYTHDAQGNTLTETLDGNVTSYSYNAKQELTASVKDGITTAYLYNPDGMRIGQGNATNQTLYTLDTNRAYAQVVQEVTDGAPVVTYTYGDDLVSQKRTSIINTYHYDGLGSTRALSNDAGGLTDSYDYDAFGETLNQTGSSENNYLFTGEQFDPNLDQYYLRARYYDQGIGRFTQMDTWMGVNSDPVTLHKYLYANVDPVNFVDPTGNFGLGSFSAAARVNGILSAVSVAQTAFDVFSIATGEQEFSARQFATSILLSRLPVKYVKQLAARYKKKTGKTLRIPCVGNSFVAGTQIHTEDGLKFIEDIQIGDKVLSYNEVSGEKEYRVVTHLIRGEKEYEIVNIGFDTEELNSTANHAFYIDGAWTRADELVDRDSLWLINGTLTVSKLVSSIEFTKVYNFTVANNHNYYVSESGVLVHNEDRDCYPSVGNMSEFFETAFGLGIKTASRKTTKLFQGQSVYKVSKNTGSLKKGQHYYLDGLHKNHLEVFDKNGKFIQVLNLDGSRNDVKTAAAIGRSIKDLLK